jgi:hypothetical protein
MTGRRLRGDAGQVAGIESVPFGLLVLVVGILLIAHTWAVVDAKFVATAAAREATRAYVESSERDDAMGAARRAAAEAVERAGRSAATVDLRQAAAGFGRCIHSRFELSVRVPMVGVPWRSNRPSVVVRAGQQEVVDPYRDGLAGLAECREGS